MHGPESEPTAQAALVGERLTCVARRRPSPPRRGAVHAPSSAGPAQVQLVTAPPPEHDGNRSRKSVLGLAASACAARRGRAYVERVTLRALGAGGPCCAAAYALALAFSHAYVCSTAALGC